MSSLRQLRSDDEATTRNWSGGRGVAGSASDPGPGARTPRNRRDPRRPVVPPHLAALLAALGLVIGVMGAVGLSRSEARPPGRGGNGWSLVFSDTFDGRRLDRDRWTTCYWWAVGGCTNEGNDELQWYRPGRVRVRDGAVRLVADRRRTTSPDGTAYEYVSGMMTTGRDTSSTAAPPRFAFRYGYVEVRARMPAGPGLWPALWLLPLTHDSRPEIDLVEVDGRRPRMGTAHVHFRDAYGTARVEGRGWRDDDLSRGWHTYGLDWRRDRIDWYVDGVRRWTFADADNIPHERMYLLANLAVGGEWVGSPTAATAFPATMAIDHVKVWQRDTDR